MPTNDTTNAFNNEQQKMNATNEPTDGPTNDVTIFPTHPTVTRKEKKKRKPGSTFTSCIFTNGRSCLLEHNRRMMCVASSERRHHEVMVRCNKWYVIMIQRENLFFFIFVDTNFNAAFHVNRFSYVVSVIACSRNAS